MLGMGHPQVWTGPGGNSAPFRMVRGISQSGKLWKQPGSTGASWGLAVCIRMEINCTRKDLGWGVPLEAVRHCLGWQREAGIPQASVDTVPYMCVGLLAARL